MAAEIGVQVVEGVKTSALSICLPRAHFLGDVAIGAVEVAAFGGVEIDRRWFQVEPQNLHFAAKSACFARNVSSSAPPSGSPLGFPCQSPQKAVSGSTRAMWVGWSMSKGSRLRGLLRSPPRTRGGEARSPPCLPVAFHLPVHQDVVRQARALGVAGFSDGDHFRTRLVRGCLVFGGGVHGIAPMRKEERRTSGKLVRNPFHRISPLVRTSSRSSGSRIVRRQTPSRRGGPSPVAGASPAGDLPCLLRPRLQRRDRHGIAPCSGILDDFGVG